MTHRKTIRPAITAIAAVMAMSATPLFAQAADAPAATPAPAVESPAPAVADPVAPAPAAETPAAADPLAAKTTSVRKTTTVKKSTARTTAARSHPVTTRVATTTVKTTAPAAIAAPAATPPADAPSIAPIVAARPAATPIAPAPPATTADTLSGMLNSDMLPIELGGLAIVVLAGGALAIRSRRRRRADEADEAAWQQQAEADPEVEAEPAMIAEPQAESAPEPAYVEPALVAASAPALAPTSEPKFIGPETDLPEGFDISRFGPNVQDAYRGPTEDNPSLSLKTRLSRASGMDQQERKLDAEVEAATGEPALDESDTAPPVEAPATKPANASPANGGFILARTAKKPVVSPTYSH